MPGTCVQGSKSILKVDGKTKVVSIPVTCTADSEAATFPATELTLTPVVGWYLQEVMTNPGSPAPQAAYDITLTDEDGFDRALGLLANRSATNTEVVQITSATNNRVLCLGNLTINISGNNVNSAVTVVTLVFIKE